MQRTTQTTLFLLVGAILFTPLVAFAAEFVPLVPLPGFSAQESQDISQYVNAVFRLAIGLGAGLAVIQIIVAGFKYMTSEAITDFKNARTEIVRTIVGFLLLLSVWLILNVINPNITNLEALNFSDIAPTAQELRLIEEEREKKAEEARSKMELILRSSDVSGPRVLHTPSSLTESGQEKYDTFVEKCRALNGTPTSVQCRNYIGKEGTTCAEYEAKCR